VHAVQTLREGPSRSSRGGAAAQAGRALGALVPALGLSNKAVYAEDAEAAPGAGGAAAQGPAYPEGPDLAPATAPAAVAGAPLEAHLAASTLWPEIVKLYGHAGEVSALAADPRGRFLASACRARPRRRPRLGALAMRLLCVPGALMRAGSGALPPQQREPHGRAGLVSALGAVARQAAPPGFHQTSCLGLPYPTCAEQGAGWATLSFAQTPICAFNLHLRPSTTAAAPRAHCGR